MLEPILKGLVEWLYGMMIDIMEYASGELLGVMSMDLSYFESTAPIISDIVDVIVALGWALLIGNLVFQSLKTIVSGAGFESEDPKVLFLRTFIFAFLLLASRQICDMCSAISGTVIDLLALPDAIEVKMPEESMFSLGGSAKWLLVIIVGVVLMVQMVKLLFEIGERYVVTSILTFFAPLAFGLGGSKNTNDIFKGWCRMYGSMLVMMIMNIVFLKLIMSAMSQMTSGGVLIWLVFVVALTRVARKIDSHIGKIGLNPAQTGDAVGSRIPGVMTAIAIRSMGSMVSSSMSSAKGGSGGSSRGGSGGRGGMAGRSGTGNGGTNSGQNRGSNPQNSRTGGGTNTNVSNGANVQNTGGNVNNNRSGANTNVGGNVNSNRSGMNTNTNNTGGNTNSTNVGGNTNATNTNGANVQGGNGTPRNRPGYNQSGRPGQNTFQGVQNTVNRQGNVNGSNTNVNRQGAVNGGYTVNRQSNNQMGQNNVNQHNTTDGSYANVNQNNAHNNNQNRPPIPRNTAPQSGNNGTRPAQVNTNVPGGKGDTHRVNVNTQGGASPVFNPIVKGGVNQTVSGSTNQGGGKTIIDNNTINNRSGRQSNVQNGSNVNASNIDASRVNGGNNGVNVGGNVQMNSQNVHDNFSHQEFSQTRNTRAETRVNHEYKHGRYNPSAANKKGRNTYYQKDNNQWQRQPNNKQNQMNRGGKNRKRKK